MEKLQAILFIYLILALISLGLGIGFSSFTSIQTGMEIGGWALVFSAIFTLVLLFAEFLGDE